MDRSLLVSFWHLKKQTIINKMQAQKHIFKIHIQTPKKGLFPDRDTGVNE